MRRIKMFEEFGFDEVTQIIISMFEDIEVSPESIEIPGTELRIWQYSNEDNKEGIDLKRCEDLLGEIGWEIRLEWEATGRDITRYCVAYETKWWNSLLVDDLNDAVYGVQSALGQDDGGYASQYFCGIYDNETGADFFDLGGYVDGEYMWENCKDDQERSIILMNYLVAETHQLYSE
jgi:hypothetical protein